MKLKKVIVVFMNLVLVFSLSACGTEIIQKKQDSGVGDSVLSDSEEVYGNIFGQGEITEINVEIKEEDWQDILNNATEEEYHSADVTVNGTTLENVGFRTKGFSSLKSVATSDSDRFGFKIKTDEYVEGQTLEGLDMFVLNGSFSDASYMREYLTYMATAYLNGITPFVTYTNLYVNGELFGFYLMIESYDDSFVERNSDSEDTVLYKAVSEDCTLLTTDDASGFEVQYGDDEENSNIQELIKVLNNSTGANKDELESILNVDSALKAWAINTVMGNYDSYSGSKAHNYYLLYSKGKFTYLGWDYNMSIGGFSEDNGASVDVDVSEPVFNTDISTRPLIEKLLAIDEYYEIYMGYVDSITEYFSDFQGMVKNISDTIDSYVENDPSAFYTFDEYKANIVESDTDLTQVKSMQINQSVQNLPREGYIPSDNMNNGYFPVNRLEDDTDQPFRGGMINQSVVSIADYINQRVDFIKTK